MGRDAYVRNPRYGEEFKKHRLLKGYPQKTLAKHVGDKRWIISLIESEGKVYPEEIRRRLEKEIDFEESEVRRILYSDSLNFAIYASDFNADFPEEALKVHPISKLDEPEFKQFLNLLKDSFDEDSRAADEDLERWLEEESETYLPSPNACENIYLVVKSLAYDVVVGLVFASYYREIGFLYIDYLAVDHALVQAVSHENRRKLAHKITFRAAPMLLEALAERTPDVRGVFAEVASTEDRLKTSFQWYARYVFKKPLYIIGADYKTPDINIEKDGTDISYDLIYFPGEQQSKKIDRKMPTLSKNEP